MAITAGITCFCVLFITMFVVYAVPAIVAGIPHGIDVVKNAHNSVMSAQVGDTTPSQTETDNTDMSSFEKGTVTRIVDGDTLDVDSKRIRLSLVNTPERGEPGYHEATGFTAEHCGVGSTVFFDEDDGQSGGSYGRVIAMVWCGTDLSPGASLNAQLIESGNAELFPHFCGKSEFGDHAWAKKAGC